MQCASSTATAHTRSDILGFSRAIRHLGLIKASGEQKIRLAVLSVDSEAIKSLVKVSLEPDDMTTALTPLSRRLFIWSAIKALRGETTTTTFLPSKPALWSNMKGRT